MIKQCHMLKKYFEKVNSTLATTVVFTSNHAFTEQKENRYSPSYPPPPPTRTGNIHIYILDVRYNLHLYNLYMNTYYINFLSLQSFFFFLNKTQNNLKVSLYFQKKVETTDTTIGTKDRIIIDIHVCSKPTFWLDTTI